MARTNVILIFPPFLLLYFISCSAIVTTSITRDQYALLELKASIIDPYHFLDNWSTNLSVCKWTGVTCSLRHHRVTTLNISNMTLAGTIPPGFGNLSFLTFLDMSNNNLHGNLPEELVHLRRLKLINFTSNNFAGQLPSWFGSLSKLQHLFLSYNRFTGPIPHSISNFTNLQNLSLAYNFLQGRIPQEIGDLHKLVSLELDKNQLHGQIPLNLYKCPQLKVLSLISNNLSGSLSKDISNLTMLNTLYLGKNKLTGVLPEEIGNLHQLEKFACGTNFLKEYGSEGLVSPVCDVYSYGIMLMETFTRTKPSDEKFTENLNMKQWIQNSLSDELNQVIDADLLRPGEEHFTEKLQSLSSIMELALCCCAESPKERMKIEDVLATLKRIKVQILAYC